MGKKINLNTEKTFNTLSHCDINDDLCIPSRVKQVAKELDGKTLPLGEAVEKIQKVTCKKVRINPTYDFILIQIKSYYGFRVVRFHSKKKKPIKKTALV